MRIRLWVTIQLVRNQGKMSVPTVGAAISRPKTCVPVQAYHDAQMFPYRRRGGACPSRAGEPAFFFCARANTEIRHRAAGRGKPPPLRYRRTFRLCTHISNAVTLRAAARVKSPPCLKGGGRRPGGYGSPHSVAELQIPQSRPRVGSAVPAFGPGRKHSLLPALATNVPPARLLNASRPFRKGA